MRLTRDITFNFADGRSLKVVACAIDEAEEPLLKAFLVEARSLQATLIALGGLPAKFSVQGLPDGRATVSVTEPSAAVRASVLHFLRPFLLENEPFAFNKIRNVVARSSSDGFLRARLKQIKHLYSGAHLRSKLRVRIGSVELASEEALRQWLNSSEYHRDSDKARALAAGLGSMPFEVSRTIFVALLGQKCNAILHLGHIVAKLVGDAQLLPGKEDIEVQG